MQNKVSTIILSDDIQTQSVLRMYLDEFELFEPLETFADYSEIYNTISSLDKSVMIVDLSENADSKLEFVLKVSNDIPNCKVLVLSDNPSVDLIVKVMRAGAKEFVALPLIKSELFQSFEKLKEALYAVPKKNTKCRIF